MQLGSRHYPFIKHGEPSCTHLALSRFGEPSHLKCRLTSFNEHHLLLP